MKIIFLDHYGVMVTSSIVNIRNKIDLPSNEEIKLTKPLDSFNRICVDNLNEVISKTNCEIVMISDWIKSHTFDKICEFYFNQGVIKTPIGYIESGKGVKKSRINGIKKWIICNSVDKYACVDDIYLDIDNFVWCQNPSIGISDSIKIEIINLLS